MSDSAVRVSANASGMDYYQVERKTLLQNEKDSQTMHGKSMLGILAGCMSAVVVAAPAVLNMNRAGSGELTVRGHSVLSIKPGYYAMGWKNGSFSMDMKTKSANVVHCTGAADGVTIDMNLEISQVTADTVCLKYVMIPQKTVGLNGLYVSLLSETSRMIGRKVVRKGLDSHVWPAAFGETAVAATAPAEGLEMEMADGTLDVSFQQRIPVLLQDDRQWGPTFNIRIGLSDGAGVEWPGGKPFEATLTMKWKDGIKVEYDSQYEVKEGDEWCPLEYRSGVKPGTAVDFSGFGFADGPAGKYGSVVARGSHFEFADKPGVPQRFYGVNFCFSAHDLSHEEADALAERLYRLGYNTVRYHHYETTIQNLYSGKSTVLNAEKMERLDYLHYALKKRGIYVTTDTVVSRRVFASEIFEGEKGFLEMNDIKMLLPVNDRMFENWKNFCRAFLGHVNPYTGMTYAEDPAVAWISLVNEGNFGNYFGSLSKHAKDDWMGKWKEWLAGKYKTDKERNAAWGTAADYAVTTLPFNSGTPAERRDFMRFEFDMEMSMYGRMRDFLRNELKCKALFTDMNCWTNPLWTQLARDQFDYVDDHFYVDHPQFLQTSWRLPSRCDNTSPVLKGTPGGGHTAFTRLMDKPFTISEYNFSGPGRFRGVGGIMLGCLAAIQDWSSIWRFAYSHSNANMFTFGTAGYFDLATDPLNQCAERATLCLYLRGDMSPAERKIAITMDEDYLTGTFDLRNGLSPSWSRMNVIGQVGYLIGKSGDKADVDVSVEMNSRSPKGRIALEGAPFSEQANKDVQALFRKQGWLPENNITDDARSIVQSVNGQLTIDGHRNMLILDTPKTAGGFALAGESISTDAAKISIMDTDATVWVSSVDGKDIAESRRLLVSHLTDLQNDHALFGDRQRKILLKWGSKRHMVRKGRAEVLIRLSSSRKNIKVYRIATDGERLSELPFKWTSEGLALALDVTGPHGAQLMYEVVSE